MRANLDAGPHGLLEPPDAQVFRAILAEDLMAFIEYSFSVVAPGKVFKPNWHFEAVAHKLEQVARGEVQHRET